ncbi:MAG: hypothetical protein MUC60_13935 [Oscillatoria sp. Prado101]|nr:hypothetical protein [Oscillatoria sp. Prado101]
MPLKWHRHPAGGQRVAVPVVPGNAYSPGGTSGDAGPSLGAGWREGAACTQNGVGGHAACG